MWRAASDAQKQWSGQQFWTTAHNNFLDIAVLEWCKVYGDKKAKHNWKNTVSNREAFFASLLEHLRLTEEMFLAYIVEMRTYRDKFIAHLDEDARMNIPNMTPAIKSTQFLYMWLVENEDDSDAFLEAPASSVRFFQQMLSSARAIYVAHRSH